MRKSRNEKRRALTMLELLVVFAIIGTMIALLLPAIHKARTAALHTHSMNNVKQIVLACQGYANTYTYFPRVSGINPKTRQPEFSFFVGLLPFLEQTNIYDAFRAKFPGGGTISDDFFVSMFVSPLDPT